MTTPEDLPVYSETIVIHLPASVLEKLEIRAHTTGYTTNEYIRQATGFFALMTDVALENGILDSHTVAEVTLRSADKAIALDPFLPFSG